MTNSDINIYVADLAAYNAGHLHGVWIDATQDVEDIFEEIKAMLADSPVECAEEYAIHDYEGFESYSLSEYTGIEEVNRVALFIENHGKLGAELLVNWFDLEQACEALEDAYHGYYTSVADFAQALTEETTEIPESLLYYVNYEAMGRDMEMSGDIYTIEVSHDEVHVFWAH